MPALLQCESLEVSRVEVDERPARAQLRRQIARLEAELAGLFSRAFGHTEVDYRLPPGAAASPRLLGLGELESVRDELASRVSEARLALARRTALEERNRERLRLMLERPAEHRWARISRAEVGEPGCGGWHSRPRLGPVGLLMGWWRVKVSSGCPLPGRLAAVER